MPKVKRQKKTPAKPKARARKPFLLAEKLERYGAAGFAGALVLSAAGAIIFWAGGYVGVLADKTDAAIRSAAVESGFEVRRVAVSGRRSTAREEIMSALGPTIGESSLHFDIEAARQRVEALGWVKSAAVSRLLPDTIQVSIRERAPAAVWQLSGAMRLIDENGEVIREIGAQDYPDLPLVVGAGASQSASGILTALNAHPDIARMTAAITRYGDRRWNLRLRNGLNVMLPESDFDDALATLAALQEDHGTLDQPLEYLDLRDPERMVARQRGAAAAVVVK